MARPTDHERLVTLEAQMEAVLPMMNALMRDIAKVLPKPPDREKEHEQMLQALERIATGGSGPAAAVAAREFAASTIRFISPIT